MPRVPDNFVPQVGQTNTNTPAVNAPGVNPAHNFSSQQMQEFGRTTERIGQMESRIGAQIQSTLDDANVKAAEAKFIQSSVDILHGENGYLNKQGADALNAYEDAQKAIAKSKQEVMDSLGNDVQKAMFNRVSQSHLVTFGARMAEHRSRERVQYTANESLSRAENMRSMVLNSDIGSADHDKYLNAGVAEIRNAYKARGYAEDSEEVKKAERQYRTMIVGDDVSRLMTANKYEDAKTLLGEQVKAGNVDPDVAGRLRAAIQANVERVENIDTADKIFASRKGLDAKDLEELLVKVDAQVKDPERRQQVRSLVSSQFSQAHSIAQQKYNDNLNDVVNYKYAHGTLKGIDPVKWGMLDAKDRYELSKPPAVETDLNTWYAFITKPETLTLDAVKKAYNTGKLTKGDFKAFTERAMAVQKERENPDYLQQAGAISARIDYFANQSGLNVYGSQMPEDKVKHGMLIYAVQNEIDRTKASQHGKITSEQVDQIIKRELTQQTITTKQRSAWNPLVVTGLADKFATDKRYTFQMPQGATMVVPGSDGKMHYSDGQNDLGAVE